MKKLLIILLFTMSSAVTAQVAETTFKNIEVTKQHNVLLLSINVPPRNTVSKAVLAEINAALNLAESDEKIGAVVITGTNKVFSAGAGGESLKGVDKGEMTHAAIAHKVYNRIESFPKPVIAAITGISAGGGNELAMSCDIRIAGESAQFRQHELQNRRRKCSVPPTRTPSWIDSWFWWNAKASTLSWAKSCYGNNAHRSLCRSC